MPKLKLKNKKWALTAEQSGQLIAAIRFVKTRAMVGLAIGAGLRRGELLAVRWRHLDFRAGEISIEEASYRGHIGTAKTEAGVRKEPLHPWIIRLLVDWRGQPKHARPDNFIFQPGPERWKVPA